MSTVLLDISMSLDGFVAGPDDSVEHPRGLRDADVETGPPAPIALMNGADLGARTMKERPMKYVILIYSNPTTWATLPPEEADRVIKEHFVVIDELTKSGELLNQFGLADPTDTKTLRIHEGAPVVTDGPFGEAKEYLAGVFLVDCESIDRVTEVSTPLAQYSTVEVRPLMDDAGLEM